MVSAASPLNFYRIIIEDEHNGVGCVCGQIILAHCESIPLSEFYSLTDSFLHAQGTAPFSAFTVDSIWCHSKPPDGLPRNKCCVGWLPHQHFHPLPTHWLFVVAFGNIMGVFLSNNNFKSVVLFSPLPFVSPSPTLFASSALSFYVSNSKNTAVLSSLCIASQIRRILPSLKTHFPHEDFNGHE